MLQQGALSDGVLQKKQQIVLFINLLIIFVKMKKIKLNLNLMANAMSEKELKNIMGGGCRFPNGSSGRLDSMGNCY